MIWKKLKPNSKKSGRKRTLRLTKRMPESNARSKRTQSRIKRQRKMVKKVTTKKVQNPRNFPALRMTHLTLVQLKEKQIKKIKKTILKIILKNLKKNVNQG